MTTRKTYNSTYNSTSNSRRRARLRYGSHLTLQGRNWLYRRAVPSELQRRLGRREIVRSLATSDLARAERLAEALDREIDYLFDVAARDELIAAEELIEQLCDKYLRRLLAEDRATRQSEHGDVDLVLSDLAEDLARQLDRKRYEAVQDDARELLKAQGATLDGPALDRLLHDLLRTRVSAIKEMIGEREGDARFDPRRTKVAPRAAAPAAPTPAEQHSVGQLAKLYIRDRTETETWKPGRGAHDRTQQVNIFVEFLGAETRLSEVTPERCMELRTHIAEGRAPGTVDKYMRALIALFNFALKRQHWIPFNPADGLRLPQRNVQEQRHPYSNEDLATLFSKDYRSRCYMKPAHKTRGADLVWSADRYWIPLLSVYSGARLGELIRLRVENVIEDKGPWCMKIEPEEGGRLKTKSSNRTLPLHSRLLALGFLDYAEDRKQAGDLYLFPQAMRLSKPESRLTDWWPKYTETVGVRTAKKTFHSLRHSVAARLTEAGTEVYFIKRILGHADESITTGRYGEKSSVSRLKEVIETLDYGCELG